MATDLGTILAALFLVAISIMVLMGVLSTRKRKKAWNRFAAETGFEGKPGWMEGDYRGHHVVIYEEVRVDEMVYRVKFRNPEEISMFLHRPTLFGTSIDRTAAWVGAETLVMRRVYKDNALRVGDPEFDREFMTIGSSEDDIRAVLDPCIRGRIMNIEDFFDFRIYEKEPNVAYYRDRRLITDTERSRLILDVIIDVVENIEKEVPGEFMLLCPVCFGDRNNFWLADEHVRKCLDCGYAGVDFIRKKKTVDRC